MIYLILFQVESYFDQAFLKEDEIGAGDFGRVFRVRSRVSLEPTLCEIFLEKVSILVPRWIKRSTQ